MSLLRADGLGLRRDGAWLLRDVTLEVEAGERLALLGDGAGDVARAIGRTLELDGAVEVVGTLELDGEPIYEADPDVHRRRVPTVAHARPFPGSVAANLRLALAATRVGRAEELRRAEAALGFVGLWGALRDRLRQPAADLDEASRARLALARALVLEPRVLVVDVPPETRVLLGDALAALRGRLAVVSVAPRADLLMRSSDRVALVTGGRVVETSPTRGALTRPRTVALEEALRPRAQR